MASRKLTALPTATEVTTSDKIYIVDVSDTTESPQGTSKQALISELPSSGITSITSTDGSIDIDNTNPSAPDLSVGYRSYVALLTQSGTSAPTVNVLKNDTGLTFTSVYDDVGNYFLEPDTAPNADKVVVFCTNASSTGDVFSFWRDDKLNVSTKASGTSTNAILSKTAVEVRIYS